MMVISTLFDLLGAPLSNTRQSWGATRADHTIVLRVWFEAIFDVDGVQYVQLIGDDWSTEKFGYKEREAHVARIVAGEQCLMVMCECVDPDAKSWEINKFKFQTKDQRW